MRKEILFIAVAILCSGAALSARETEVARLEKENRELREKLIKAEKELAGCRVWLASSAFDHTAMKGAEREVRLLRVLEELARRGNMLSMSALAVNDECRRLLEELPLGPVRKAQMKLRLDELERAAGVFAGLAIPGNSDAGSCQVLAVDRKAANVVLSAGAGVGVFPGMVFTVKGNPQLKVRVIATLFEGSLAEIVSGTPGNFAAGMEMSALTRKTQQREHILDL